MVATGLSRPETRRLEGHVHVPLAGTLPICPPGGDAAVLPETLRIAIAAAHRRAG